MPEAGSHPNASALRNLGQVEWGLALALTLAAVFLHLTFFQHAGGLWRDEAGVVSLATLPDFGETFSRLGHESCPVLFPGVMRIWTALGLGSTDFTLRIYGLLTGLLLLGALWLNARWMTRSVPLLSLGLLATNLTVVRWGDSLRAYGLGSALMLLSLALIWRYAQAPSRQRWLVAAVGAVFSVQTLFQNSFLLLAACLAACLVRLRLRDERRALAALGIGIPAAASLIPYVDIINRAQDWSKLSQSYDFGVISERFVTALGGVKPWASVFWIAPVLLALVCGGRTWFFGDFRHSRETSKVTIFAAAALVGGILGFWVFVRLALLPTRVWYYLPLLMFLGVCLDAALSDWLAQYRFWRLAYILVLTALLLPMTCEQVRFRQTNMDQIAAVLRQQAGPNDLIIVHPWYMGISFSRYYSGAAAWITIPPIEDHRFHRYDLLKKKIQMEDAIQPVLSQVAGTLQSTNHIWVVGQIPFDGVKPPAFHPAPNNPWGWLDGIYVDIWGAQVGNLIVGQARKIDLVLPAPENGVNPLESVPLYSISGGLMSGSPIAPGQGSKLPNQQ